MFRMRRILAALVLGSALLAGTAAAQCPLPDGLDGGPCCTRAPLRLPVFPPFAQQTMDICWRDCNVDQVGLCVARWSQPIPPPQAFPQAPPCNILVSDLQLFDPATGALKWRGTMWMQYARTWLENNAGQQFQVWRFLVNGELNPTAAAGAPPCPVPACAPAFNNRVRWTGYIDYAQDCANLTFNHSWMLNHECDAIDHAPGFPRAGTFHPDRSFTFVAPAAGFVPNPNLPVEAGAIVFEDVRRVNLPVPGFAGSCEFEERIVFGNLNPIAFFCPCTTLPATNQYVQSQLTVNGACGTSVFSPGGPFLPGFVSKSIGTWTIPAAWPGVEDLRWNCGGYDYFDPCTGVLRQEIFFGVTTRFGFPATQLTLFGPGAPLPPTFVDQSNSLRQPGYATVMNIRYVSDHILNLNLP